MRNSSHSAQEEHRNDSCGFIITILARVFEMGNLSLFKSSASKKYDFHHRYDGFVTNYRIAAWPCFFSYAMFACCSPANATDSCIHLAVYDISRKFNISSFSENVFNSESTCRYTDTQTYTSYITNPNDSEYTMKKENLKM